MTGAGRWLTVSGRVVAPIEVAADRRARRRGLLGRSTVVGALLLRPAGSVHTVGMAFPLDVALCTADLRVVAVRTLVPGRLTRPRWGVRAVVEAEAGAFARWDLRSGVSLAIVAGAPDPGRLGPTTGAIGPPPPDGRTAPWPHGTPP